MTPKERLEAERDRIQQERGFYITPFRMANLMTAASKVASILVKADTNIRYEECRFILDIVSASIDAALKEEASNDE